MRYLAVFLLFFIATPAFAFTWDSSPVVTSSINGTGDFTEFTVNITGDSVAEICQENPFDPPPVTASAYVVSLGLDNNGTWWDFNPNDWILGNEQTGLNTSNIFTSNSASEVSYIFLWCIYDSVLTPIANLQNSSSGQILFTLIPVVIPPAGNVTWGSDNGFWGNSTPSQVSASVIEGTQDTGANLWPLLIFLGISLAFIIFVQVVALTRHTTRIAEKEKKRKKPY